MTFIIKHKPLPGSPMMAEYVCPVHGRFEMLVERDEHGDPPPSASCPGWLPGPDELEVHIRLPAELLPDAPDELEDDELEDQPPCAELAELVISAPSIKYWSRDPVPIGYASKSDEKDPRALDTEPLATGKMTKAEWLKYQRGISAERRYQKKLKAGKISKRIQVGGG
jgi:hypothetical protein